MRNEAYIFIRGSTWITWDMVSGKLAFARFNKQQQESVWVDGWTRGMGGMCTEMGSSIVMYNYGVGAWGTL